MQRMVPMQLVNQNALIQVQRLLGQLLFSPPNVAGWPGGKSWIDSSTLMARLRIPQMFTDKDELNLTPKQDDDQLMGRRENATIVTRKKNSSGINATIDWPRYMANYQNVKKENLMQAIKQNLLQVNAPALENALGKTVDVSSRESYIKTVTIQLMSTPEYQMC